MSDTVIVGYDKKAIMEIEIGRLIEPCAYHCGSAVLVAINELLLKDAKLSGIRGTQN